MPKYVSEFSVPTRTKTHARRFPFVFLSRRKLAELKVKHYRRQVGRELLNAGVQVANHCVMERTRIIVLVKT